MRHTSVRSMLIGLATFLAATLPIHAATIYTDLVSWQAALVPGPVNNTTALGAEFSVASAVSLVGGGSLSFAASDILTVGSGWATWSGGYAGQVLFAGSGAPDDITLTLTGVLALALEVQPNDLSASYDITFALSDGSTTTLSVAGLGGAQFFGFADPSITSVTFTADPYAAGFAFGNFYTGTPQEVPVPAPAALGLFGLGMLGLFAARRRVG